MLKSKEVCELIKFCGEAGVSEMKWGDLQVCFGTPKKADLPPETPDTEISELTAQSSAQTFRKEESELRDDELAHLLIEDPAKYEELMLTRELEGQDSGKVNGGAEED